MSLKIFSIITVVNIHKAHSMDFFLNNHRVVILAFGQSPFDTHGGEVVLEHCHVESVAVVRKYVAIIKKVDNLLSHILKRYSVLKDKLLGEMVHLSCLGRNHKVAFGNGVFLKRVHGLIVFGIELHHGNLNYFIFLNINTCGLGVEAYDVFHNECFL